MRPASARLTSINTAGKESECISATKHNSIKGTRISSRKSCRHRTSSLVMAAPSEAAYSAKRKYARLRTTDPISNSCGQGADRPGRGRTYNHLFNSNSTVARNTGKSNTTSPRCTARRSGCNRKAAATTVYSLVTRATSQAWATPIRPIIAISR